jgi:type IV secretion system protein VirB9
MNPRYPLLAVLAVAVSPAHADPRITTHFYQPSEIVTIHGRSDTQSTIAFAPDERIENVAVGDSASWQVTPNKRADLLFVKPMNDHARTNMTVVTDQRTYLFDLINAPRTAAVYMLRFTYPTPPKVAPPFAPPPAAIVAVASDTPPEPDPANLNFAWVSQGDKALLPSRSYDDGQSTYLTWSADVALPAILVREPGGTEGPVNYTVRGDTIVVDGVPPQLVLRSGKQVATLTPAARAQTASRADRPKKNHAFVSEVHPGPPYALIASRQP